MAKPTKRRRKPVDRSERRGRKKPRVAGMEEMEYVDYKDVALLSNFMSERGKIRARRVTGLSTQKQRAVANAIKNAREMALLPYTGR